MRVVLSAGSSSASAGASKRIRMERRFIALYPYRSFHYFCREDYDGGSIRPVHVGFADNDSLPFADVDVGIDAGFDVLKGGYRARASVGHRHSQAHSQVVDPYRRALLVGRDR